MNIKPASTQGNTISSRLLICFLISTLIPTIIITAGLCLQFDHSYREIAKNQMQVSLELISDNVNSHIREATTITTAPYYHSYFSSRHSMDPEDSEFLNQLNDFQAELMSLISLTTYSHNDITDLIIWSDGQYLYQSLYNELWYFKTEEKTRAQSWFIHALEANGKVVFTPTYQMPDPVKASQAVLDTSSFYITRKINNIRQPDQENMVILNLNTRHFDETLQNLNLLYDSFVVITNERNELLYSSKSITMDALTGILREGDFHYSGNRWSSISYTPTDYLLKVHVIYSLDDLSRHTTSLILSALLIYSLGLLSAFLLFRRYNRWISHSTDALRATFLRLENGDLTAQCPPVDVMEFHQIGCSVNDMIAKLNEKIKNEYLMTIQQKSIQLYALQSQIQPHFLINTIYCFIALNQMGERDKLNSAFFNLAHLLRYVLSKERYTTLGKECDFLTDYLKLQQMRFGSRLSYEIQCDPAHRKLVIPRLLLQPLVENAIIHGIEPCSHPCTCRIRIVHEAPHLHIYIEDDGVGFDTEDAIRKSEDAARKAFQPVPHPEEPPARKGAKASVGLYYVKERLKMWSEQATLHICCEEITRAEIQIPWEEIEYESNDR